MLRGFGTCRVNNCKSKKHEVMCALFEKERGQQAREYTERERGHEAACREGYLCAAQTEAEREHEGERERERGGMRLHADMAL